VGVNYRRLTADEWLVGKERRQDLSPNGGPVEININSLDFTVAYGVTDRLSLSLTLPFSTGTQSRFYTDGQPHQVSATGLGDINLSAWTWILDPPTHWNGNVALGLGIKLPTGSNNVEDTYYDTNGPPRYFVDQSIQLGDGGWGILLQTQAFQKLVHNVSGYLAGYYLITPQAESDVVFTPSTISPYAGVRLAVPDVYNVRGGLTLALTASPGLSFSLGGRLDGIAKKDLLGGGDDAFRRPAIQVYADPGLGLSYGPHTFSLNVPVRVYYNFRASLLDEKTIKRPAGGDLAKYLIFAGYTHRF
jgi:hypothetical protein